MKGLKILLLLFITMIGVIPVKAANYELEELIPVNIETTIVTNNFSYKDFYYLKGDNDYIAFKGIKNLTDEDKPITISIALFDKDKKNIGTINYCSSKGDANSVQTVLKSGEEISYSIEVTKDYFGKGHSKKEVAYMAVLNDNIRCRVTGVDDYIGQDIKEIGTFKNTVLDSNTQLMIDVFTFVGIVLFALFLYKFMFTRAYTNFDGNDVRNGFKDLNRDLAKERARELKRNPPKEKEPVKVKSDEVLLQEEAAKNEDKSGTDLHNLYK